MSSFRRHRDDPECYVVDFDAAANADTLQALVYNLLKQANRIATSWVVLGPMESINGVVELEGIVDRGAKVHVRGLDWAHYTLYFVPPTVGRRPVR